MIPKIPLFLQNLPTGWQPRPLHGAALLVGALLCVTLGAHHRSSPEEPAPKVADAPPEPVRMPMATPPPPENLFTSPTPQRQWTAIEDPDVYMPTGSGRVVSAAFGSTRTDSRGRARFHEGVDIAPTAWQNGRALDSIFAVADGRIAYINRSAGNSSYGIYLVLDHPDPAGTLITLYAHLASVEDDLREGQSVRRGQVLGTMGHSSTMGIPRQRSHLHFEMGLRLHSRFRDLYRRQGRANPHGNDHGHNLFGFDPRRLLFDLEDQDPVPFSALASLQREVPAWRILLRTDRRPDFFRQHPALWSSGGQTDFRGIVVDVLESGLPLWGRPAREEEMEALQGQSYQILGVNETVLGRNGRRHVLSRGSQWILGSVGEAWRTLLLYDSP